MLEVDEKKVDFDGSYVFYDETLGMDATDLSNGENNTENASAENGLDSGDVKFNSSADAEKKVSLEDIALKSTFFNNIELQVVKQHSSPLSPPPFMVGMVEVEVVGQKPGNVDVLDYVAAVDCGTPIRIQILPVYRQRAATAQGIGMALSEDVWYNEKGVNLSNSLMQYKIPTRLDFDKIRVEFESSYEPKQDLSVQNQSVRLVIDTPCSCTGRGSFQCNRCTSDGITHDTGKDCHGYSEKTGRRAGGQLREACLACIGFVLEFLIFYAAGSLLAKILKIKADISFVFILGYLGYFAVFELLIVPMTLLWVPLTAAYVGAVFMAVLVVAAAVWGIISLRKRNRKSAGIWKQHSWMIFLAGAAVLHV